MNRETMLQIAKECGLQVIFDNKLGREEYQSVFSSEPALERFANRIIAEGMKMAAEKCEAQSAYFTYVSEQDDTQQFSAAEKSYGANCCSEVIRAMIKEVE